MYFTQLLNQTRIIIIASVLVTLSSCGNQSSSTVSTVSLDGSSTVFPISEAVAEEFRNVQPKVRVTVGVSGTGGGFKKFFAGEIDINNASRAIKDKELQHALEKNVQFIEVPIAFDGLSIVINKQNTWVNYLTVAELSKIWQVGSKVNRWNQVRANWPDIKISLFGPGTDSGTFDYFTKVINGKEGASRSDYTASEDDNTLVQGVSGEKGAIGYFGFAYYIANKDKLKVVPIKQNNKQPVIPTLKTINNGTYAPLSRPIFIYINPQSLARPAVVKFIRFYLENAAHLAQEVGYIALPPLAYTKGFAKINQKIVGTSYASDKYQTFATPNILK